MNGVKTAGFPTDLQAGKTEKGLVFFYNASFSHVTKVNIFSAKSIEPQFQRKKRVEVSSVVAGNGYDDPYMLLGQNEKFANNVQYKASRKAHVSSIKIFP